MANDRDIDPASIFLRENYERDEHAFRIAEGFSRHDDDDQPAGRVSTRMVVAAIGIPVAIGAGALLALAWRAIG